MKWGNGPQANIITITPPTHAKIITYKFENTLPKIVINYKSKNTKFIREKFGRYHPLSEKG